MPVSISSSLKRRAIRSPLLTRLLGILGAPTIPPAFVNRAVANGLVAEDLDHFLQTSDKLEDLPHRMASIAREAFARGHYWQELGLKQRARDTYLNASLLAFYAQLLLPADSPDKPSIYSLSAESYRRASSHFDFPARTIEIPYQTGNLIGYLRFPDSRANKRPYRCVILINGITSTKEELHYSENAFLKMGLATLSFDLPGTGESLSDTLHSLSAEILGNSLYLYLAGRPDINPDQLALYGMSTGGAIALRIASILPDRFQAIATLSAPYDLETSLKEIGPGRNSEVSLILGQEAIFAPPSFFELYSRVSAKGIMTSIGQPLLVASGGSDPLIPGEDTRTLFESASSQDKKLLLCPKAGHGCPEMMPSLRYEIAQWIKQRI